MTRSSSNRSRLNVAALTLAIGAISLGLWLSPVGQDVKDTVQAQVPFTGGSTAVDRPSPRASKTPSASPTASPTSEPTSPAAGIPTTLPAAFTRPPRSLVPSAAPSVHGTPGTTPGKASDASPDHDPPPSPSGPRIEGCWSFTWQQDAQAVYAADLSDPHGLDGVKGGYNGDGLACTQLPVDPSRPRSVAVGAYVPPVATIATKAELVDPDTKYFGVAEDGVPGDTALMDRLSTQVGKAPSMVEWFSTWDEDYNTAKVQKSWARGALPVISWMPAHKGNKNPSDISLQKIVDGKWDAYVLRYAGEIVREGKPVVIRFAHEQNGNWYPWSAGGNRRFERGANGEEPFFNTPALYRAAWQHVWTLFEEVGANQEAIWAYTPVRTEGITPNTTDKSKTSYGMTSIAQGYPGNAYVDWVGMSGYSYKGKGWSYRATFSKTFNQLKAVAPGKPILVAETGASENQGAVSNTTRKAFWIRDTLRGLAADPRVVGFVWFNNTVVDVHTIDGVRITTDNKWDTSPKSLAAFTTGIADAIWSTGKAPDTVVTVTASTSQTAAPVPQQEEDR
jgi:mannan endo-1,4-beta-mannosidase